jgi:hypothetical protein
MFKSSHAFRWFVALLVTLAPAGRVAQALTDTDSDGMDDGWEITHFGNLSATSAGDSDSDGMTNGEEYLHGFVPTVNDAFADSDGDRYPNVFEVRSGSNPNDASNIPTPTYVVNGAGGGTHTTVSAALGATNVANGAYQIIGIAPGVYSGAANLSSVNTTTSKPKLLFIGLDGAAETVIDGGGTSIGWRFHNSAVISSLTFRNTLRALSVEGSGKEVRFVDLIVRNNTSATSDAAGLDVYSGATGVKVYVVGSTFLDNTGTASVKQINIGTGAATLVNTVVWSQTLGTMLAKATGATLTTNNCLVKGQTLTGTGNLAGNVDPELRADGYLLWNSPLRGAGGTVAQSRVDIDGELRPSTAPDIGVDQFNDLDADELADQWELDYAGNLTTLTSRSQNADGDGLSNEDDYANGTDPVVADTDGDSTSDGDEVLVHGSNPLNTDTDGDDMPDGWEIAHALSPLVASAFDDDDGDRYPNVFEYTYSTDPSDDASTPTPTYQVNGAGGGTHTTVSAALSAANVANGAYQIIGIAPGVYAGAANLSSVTVASTKPKLLFIGLEGAAETVIDGGGTSIGWRIYNSAVISSLTIRNTLRALWVDGLAKEVRFVDLTVRDNTSTTSDTAGVQVDSSATGVKVYVVGSTFLDNTGTATVKQINISAGAATIVNTVVWSQTSGTMLAKATGATMTTNNCLVKGQTLTGTGNLAGNVDPKLRADAHLLWNSPLRGAGGTVAQSRVDIDGEFRPNTAPDIGVDQFNDSDGDELADQWEFEYTGNLTTLTGRSQEGDGDGLSNEGEYANGTSPLVADTDGDSVSDGDEVLVHGSNPLNDDTDGDDMPDGWETTHELTPLVANTFDDDDGDRYPNVFEYAYSTDPSDSASAPTPTYVVNSAGGGTHTTISAALGTANVTNGAYQIIGIAPGVYTGVANLSSVTVGSTKPKLLFIGLGGAAKTVIDGGGTNSGWRFINSAVTSSLTFRNTLRALSVEAAGREVRFVDLIVRDNRATVSDASGLQVQSGATGTRVYVVGSTFLDNTGAATSNQIKIEAGAATVVNTVVWSQTSGTMLAKATGATLTTNNCLVKGQTLTGTGNLAGNVDPKLLSDGHLLRNSPLRGTGGTVAQSRTDVDGELRPSIAPDIGVDQFNDPDGDGLPDAWEIANFGSATSMIGSADEDNDQLSNAEEYDWSANWLDPDTDKDGVMDGFEVAHGDNPAVADADEMVSDLNQDGLIDSIGAQLGYQPDQLDSDGDSISNADEMLMGTSPLRADSDGDGVPDGTDKFPLDPLMSALPSDPQDATPPVITLTAPSSAIEQ